jgi:diguanylate cyclase (GGDEF)-like protein
VRRLRDLSLLGRFSLLSLLVVLALGVVLSAFLARLLEQRAVDNAQASARAIALTAAQQHLTRLDLGGELTPRRLDELDEHLHNSRMASLGVQRVKVFGPTGELVYSDDRTMLGERVHNSSLVFAALRGEIRSKLIRDEPPGRPAGHLLEVYVPLERAGRVEGVLEVYLDYEPVIATIRGDERALAVALGAGLLVLWLTLYRIVAGASRRLQLQASESHAQARTDALTGLANRVGLHERALERTATGLLLIDLDHFKEVNDTLGHDHGDLLIRQVADRLRALVGPADVLARLGGDEFALLLGAGGSPPAERAAALHAVLAEPVELASLSVAVEASIGIALAPDHGETIDDLLKHADVALYAAKEAPERVVTYAPELDPYTAERLALAGELRGAAERGELVVFYQPIVDAPGQEVRGVEALVRWQHPVRGLLAPGEFLPLAERTGTIGELTRFVLEEALRQAHAWRVRGLDLEVAVNLAAASASDPRLPELVANALRRWPVPAHRLVLELSEETVITDPRRVGDVLARLHAQGVGLALDDFGTGQSSLAYLKRLPLDQLKIDRTFVTTLERRGEADVIRAMVALARSFGLQTVAEGVEDARTAGSLSALGCDRLQGFHFGRPVPAAELEAALLRELPGLPRAA